MWRFSGIALTLVLAACSGPFFLLPGGALSGPEGELAEVELQGDGDVIQLETRPSDPYSVNLNAFFLNGFVYIDPAEDRAWYQHLVNDANVRVRFSNSETIYPARVVKETDAEVLAKFESDRIVMRLEPR